MATPTLTPRQTTSAITLPQTGSHGNVTGSLPFAMGLYTGSAGFLSGAVDQVAYTYKKLGGDVLDIEITEGQVYSAYEEAVLEYSYIVNVHQAKNSLSSMLGASTGSFDSHGQLLTGNSLSGSNVELKFPKFEVVYAQKVGAGLASRAGFGGDKNIYSASFDVTSNQQTYDVQQIISSSAVDTDNASYPYYNKLDGKKIHVTKVFYKTPHAMWRFYGYYGGLNTVGDLASYGQFSDDSTFELIPAWQNKAQAMGFEDAIYTRNSHYSYQIKNNNLTLYPAPVDISPDKFWVEFYVEEDPWVENAASKVGTEGINNMNTLPFENIPYHKINSIGKQWIRRFALAVSKEMLGNIRSKFATIPIPGESVTLNGADLISQSKDEQEKLREELKTVLDELTYSKLMETDAATVESVNKIQERIPLSVYVG
jgi:hypothetical protein